MARLDEGLVRLLPVPRWRLRGQLNGALVCVYRCRNASLVQTLVESAESLGLTAYLWALDEADDQLLSRTRGVGPGSRSQLLSRLAEDAAAEGNTQVTVMTDDDVRFTRGGLEELIAFAVHGGFRIVQPAHTWDSNFSYHFTVGRAGLLARATRFVEIGPLLVIDQSMRERIFPFPADAGMGWGLEVAWNAALGCDESFAIVDAVRIQHLGRVGGDYADAAAEQKRVAAALLSAGLYDTNQLCVTNKRWPIWTHDFRRLATNE